MAQPHSEKVILKLVVKNAFNSMRQEAILQAA